MSQTHAHSNTQTRNWSKDWDWVTQATPYRAGFLWYHWNEKLDTLDDKTLLLIIGELDYGSIHMKRFKYRAKKVFLNRFVEDHYPVLLP